MSKLKQGKDTLLYIRLWENRATDDGTKIKFRTEHTVDYAVNNETLQTDDGALVVISDGENTISATAYAYENEDGTVPLYKLLRNYMLAKKKLEIWEVERYRTTGEAHDARYFQGYLISVSEPKPVEGASEVSLEFALEGHGVDGLVTLTVAQESELNASQYEFEQIQALEASEPEVEQ